MGIFTRKGRGARAAKRDARARDEPAVTTLSGLPWRSSEFRANASEAICAAAGRMANTLASAPLRLYQNEQVQSGDALDRLVAFSPAPGWNAFAFVRDMELTRGTTGRAYAAILRDGDQMEAQALIYLDPAKVQTLRARETGDLWHKVATEGGESILVHDSDMLRLTWLSSGNGLTPQKVLGGTLEYDAQVKDFSLNQLDGVHDTILIQVPGGLSPERRATMAKDILNTYQATGKTALILDSGAQASRLAAAAVNPQVLNVEKVTKSRVSAVYGLPAHLLGAGESAKQGSEEEMQEFLTLSIVPAAVQWEAELNKKLLTYERWAQGYRFAFDLTALSRANTAVLAEKYFKGVRGAWMKPNEVRKKEGLPPDPNGDTLVISRDLLPLEYIITHPEELITGGRGKTNGEGENS